MSFHLPVKELNQKGQNRMWAIYPLPGDYTHSIRVNQLIDYSKHPPRWSAPRIEISDMWLDGPHQLVAFRTALDQAELKVIEYGNDTGERVDS